MSDDDRHIIRTVAVGDLLIDAQLQPRAQLYGHLVREYQIAYEAGARFPPLVAFEVDGGLLLADGFHRLNAQRRLGRREVEVDIRQGDRRDAIRFSREYNSMHGARFTTADKQRAIMTFLDDDEWTNWSDRDIARALGTDHKTVGKYRREMMGVPAVRKTTPSDDKAHQVKATALVELNDAGALKPGLSMEAMADILCDRHSPATIRRLIEALAKRVENDERQDAIEAKRKKA